ncbi:splicing factor, CC1-like protein [Pyrenochaeta sp. DS3sAY3a]|nr:splicing factor, CC1-like protein [Pyrenochaeta sp. DS3sAY3a]
MATPNAVEALLDEAANNVELAKANVARASNGRHEDRGRNGDRYSPHRDLNGRPGRNDRNDRNGRDYRNDRTSHRGRGTLRESDGDRRRSRDRDGRRRDDSQPRSSKGADNTDYDNRNRRPDNEGSHWRPQPGGRGGDFYDGRSRARSRSPRRDENEDSSRDRRGSNDRGRRGGDERGRRGRNSATPPEDDRDKRTIFVQQISQRTRTIHLREFFEQVGTVIEAQIVKDRVTGRTKGVGYVEFKDIESVEKALEKTGHKLKGIPIIVQLTEAEKNRAARPSEGGAAAGANGAPFHRLYVGNIHFSIGEDDLKQIFLPFGELDQVTLQRDEANPGRSKGYGFVQFVNPDHAKKALQEMNGFELANRQIRVGLGNDKFTPESTANLLRQFGNHTQNYQGSAFSGAGGRGANAGGSGVFDRTHGKDDRSGVSGASALDDTDVSGINFRTYDRGRLMTALARDNASKQTAPVAKEPKPAPTATTAPSRCIKIENVFDAEEEYRSYGANWVKDLETEIKTECVAKYGPVDNLHAEPDSEGDILVKFESIAGAKKATQGLNGRSFNGRTLSASFMVESVYEALRSVATNKSK